MKKLFAPALLGAWVAGFLPDRLFWLGRKTPWYRQSWMANVPLITAVLVAPLALFLLWKGAGMMRQKSGSEAD